MRPHPTISERGFTLIEIMVAVTLLGLLMGGMYTVTVGTMKAKDTINEQAALNTAGPRILDLIELDLRSAYSFSVKEMKALKAQRQTVGGEEVTVLDLLTSTNSKRTLEVDDRMVRSDVTEVGWRLRRNDEYTGLLEIYRREDFFFDDDPLKGGDYHLVYDRVRAMVIDFFEPLEEGGTTSSRAREDGKEDWDSEEAKGLPRAARITLELGPPEDIYADLETDERRFKFVRWVLFPNADDRTPAEEGGNGDGGPQQPGNGR